MLMSKFDFKFNIASDHVCTYVQHSAHAYQYMNSMLTTFRQRCRYVVMIAAYQQKGHMGLNDICTFYTFKIYNIRVQNEHPSQLIY